jgi:hypothetical protein
MLASGGLDREDVDVLGEELLHVRLGLYYVTELGYHQAVNEGLAHLLEW